MDFRGAIRLFRIWGIDVFLHWSWLLVAVIEIQQRRGEYSSIFWNILEYVSLFAIVLMHEFGHALACRSVGGIANRIVLWPLGGVAFVQPPMRPGAWLWSIVAGPLVNVVLAPIFFVLSLVGHTMNAPPDLAHYIWMLFSINLLLLIFNLLPIYPLDGGKILWALLWFIVGPVKSLRAAAMIGIVGVVGGVIFVTMHGGNIWLYLICAFAAIQCFAGLQQARAMERTMQAPRRADVKCPNCGQNPPVGPYWKCTCGESFDTFATMGTCPRCGVQHYVTGCPDCRTASPLAAWYGPGGQFPGGQFPVVFNRPPAFNSGEMPQQER